mmetsp:Transcript_22787/g.33061  ORF Transcript_22787/g.33061 Transcript_22787/m.33061 type:complete len:262 (-) Transcript_22787:438-1223(-)
MCKMCCQPASTSCQGVTQGYSTSIHIGLLPIQPQIFFTGQVLGCKCLIYLNPVHLVEGHPCGLEGLGNGRRRANPHDLWGAARAAPPCQPGQRSEVVLLDGILGGQHNGARPVTDAGGVGGRDPSAILPEHGRKVPHLLQAHLARVFIGVHRLRALPGLDLNGGQLRIKALLLVGHSPCVLTPDRVFVTLLPGDTVFVSQVLCGDAHGGAGVGVREPAPQGVLQLHAQAQPHPPPRRYTIQHHRASTHIFSSAAQSHIRLT